jgi:hypothetical protein
MLKQGGTSSFQTQVMQKHQQNNSQGDAARHQPKRFDTATEQCDVPA